MSFDPVSAQLEAYNARDIDRFMPCFADDCVVEDGRGNVLMSGAAEMREKYGAMFAASPGLFCTVVTRVRAGDYVMDEERVVGRQAGGELHVMVVYRLEGERIAHVRILR